MAKLIWDAIGEKIYENGVQQGVLYPVQGNGSYSKGYAWNGLTGVSEKPTGAEAKANYADNINYANMVSAESFGATIEAFTYPDEFGVCDGSAVIAPGVTIGQQGRKLFGMCYKTKIGNDSDGGDHGYKLHLIYGALAAPSEKAYASVNDSPEAIKFSWEVKTTPVSVAGFKPTASLTINSTTTNAAKLAALENLLYGTESADPRLPLPDEVASIVGTESVDAITVASSPIDDATTVLTSSDVILTFNNQISNAILVVATAAGVKVTGTTSWDVAKKVLTFHPTSSLTAGTTYIVALAGVTDIYGQTLADQVTNFATAS